MAGFLNAFIPTSQIAGGGLAEWQAARERYAKQQQALQGYKAGLEQLAGQNPQYGWLKTALSQGAPANELFGALAPEMMKQGNVESQRQTLLKLGQAYVQANPSDNLAKAYLGVLQQPNLDPSVLSKAWGYFESKPPTPKALSGDDAAIARSISLDPNNTDAWSPDDAAKFEQAKTVVVNARRPELPPMVQYATTPTGPAVISVPRNRGGGIGAPTVTPLSVPVGTIIGAHPTDKQGFTQQYLQEHPGASIEEVARAYTESKAVPLRAKLLSGDEAAAALETGLPLDQTKWDPAKVPAYEKTLAEIKAGKRAPQTIKDPTKAAIARSLGLPLDPSRWSSEQAEAFVKRAGSISSKQGRYFYDPGMNQWKWVEKGSDPPKGWLTSSPKAEQAKFKGYVTKNIGGESYGLNPATGLVSDLGQQQPQKTGLFASLSGSAPPPYPQRLQSIIAQVKANGIEVRRRGEEFFARGNDGKIYQLTQDLSWKALNK